MGHNKLNIYYSSFNVLPTKVHYKTKGEEEGGKFITWERRWKFNSDTNMEN